MKKKEKSKIKYDKNTLCKCGKPAPIMPYYCEVCKRGSTKGKKIKVIEFGKMKLPSGIILK